MTTSRIPTDHQPAGAFATAGAGDGGSDAGPRQQVQALIAAMNRAVLGQQQVVERMVIGLLADGHVLLEGLPGLAKTRAVKAMASALAADFTRVQFTPDLLPSDVTGSEVYYSEGGTGHFRFQPGPVFGNILLADEINRAPAKVQSALLEAMEERQVTVDGKTYEIDLSEKNAAKLRTSLRPWTDRARTSGRPAPSRQRLAAVGHSRNAAIRAWAHSSGHAVPARGRIPRRIVAAYDAANN